MVAITAAAMAKITTASTEKAAKGVWRITAAAQQSWWWASLSQKPQPQTHRRLIANVVDTMRTTLIAFNKSVTRSKAIDLIPTGVANLPLGHISDQRSGVGVQRHLTSHGKFNPQQTQLRLSLGISEGLTAQASACLHDGLDLQLLGC